MEAIETVMHGNTYFSDEAAQALTQNNSSEKPVLTRHEKEVLQLIVEGLTNNEIAKQLFVSPATVDTHRRNLLAKLDAKNAASLVRISVQLQLT